MKGLFAALIVLSTSLGAVAQVTQGDEHTFQVIQDDPKYVSDKLLGMQLCGPATFSSFGGLNVGIGVNGLWALQEKLQIQGSLDWYLVQVNGGMGFALEGGPALTLTERSKLDEAKVVLKYSERSYDTPTEHVKESSATWINSQATFLSKFKARGGLYVYDTEYKNEKKFSYGALPYTMAGLYGGFEFSKQAALISEVDGQRGITSGLTRIYVDALILPLRAFGGDSTGTIRDAIGGGIFGGRAGFQAYFNPNKAKRATPKMRAYQVWPTLFWKIEAGYRPAEKLFFTMGMGFLLWKNR